MTGEKTNKSLKEQDLDKEGFLRDYTTWCEDIAPSLAATESIVLTPEHWEIIHIVRAYYQKYHVSPTTRVLAKIVRQELGTEKGKSIYLMKLFSPKAAKLVAKISGLPKPNNCD